MYFTITFVNYVRSSLDRPDPQNCEIRRKAVTRPSQRQQGAQIIQVQGPTRAQQRRQARRSAKCDARKLVPTRRNMYEAEGMKFSAEGMIS